MKDSLGGFFSLAAIVAGVWLGFFWHPEHTHRIGFLKYQPEPGYFFASGAPFFRTQWNPGVIFPDNEHVMASDLPGFWAPAPGYRWDDAADADTETRPANSVLAVKWSPGIAYAGKPHIMASTQEGYWQPLGGYTWSNRDELLAAWTPGLTYPGNVCLVSGTEEGNWAPISNHHLSRDENGRIHILADSSDPNWGGAVGNFIVALTAKSVSRPSDDDSIPVSAAKMLGDHIAGVAFDAGLKDIFSPTANDQCANVMLGANWH